MAKLITILLVALIQNSNLAMASDSDLKTVPFVDVGRYLGTWYRIASNPLFFEGKCSCSRQVLSLNTDSNISVYNSCNEFPGGPLREIRGVAINQDPTSNSKLIVDFGFPHKGQYWIIGLDAEYRWAVVSDPSKTTLYILSKTPELSADEYKEAISTAEKQLDTSKLVFEVQKDCTYP